MSIETLHALQEPDLTPPSGIPRPADVESRIAPDLDSNITSIFSAQTAQTAQALARLVDLQNRYDIRERPEYQEVDQAPATGIVIPVEPTGTQELTVKQRRAQVAGNVRYNRKMVEALKVTYDVNGKVLPKEVVENTVHGRSHHSLFGSKLVDLAGKVFSPTIDNTRIDLKPLGHVRSRPEQNR